MVWVQSGPKFEILLKFSFMKNTTRKTICWRCRFKTRDFRRQKHGFKETQTWHICKGDSPWFWSKSLKKILFFVFIKNWSRKSVFDILDRREAYKDYKSICLLKEGEIWIFPKGLVHSFGPKCEISLTLIFFAEYNKKMYLQTFKLENRFFVILFDFL